HHSPPRAATLPFIPIYNQHHHLVSIIITTAAPQHHHPPPQTHYHEHHPVTIVSTAAVAPPPLQPRHQPLPMGTFGFLYSTKRVRWGGRRQHRAGLFCGSRQRARLAVTNAK
nr:hypothetical protein [Tanacetum cinerariifolium]